MTVSSEQSSVSYDGDGITNGFAVPFYFLVASDLQVSQVSQDGAEVPLVLNTDYTVSGAGNPAGGSVSLVGTPTPVGKRLVIDRDPPVTQETSYQSNDPFPAKETEKAFDKLTMLVQRLTRTFSNSIHFPLAESTDGTLPKKSARSNQLLGFDVNGSPVMFPITSSVGAGDRVPFSFLAGTDFNPGDTTLTLPRAPGSKGNVEVNFDAAAQDFTQWDVSDANLTFTSPIPAGVTRIWGYIGTTLSTSNPPDGSVTDVKVAPNAAINAAKIAYIAEINGAGVRSAQDKFGEQKSIQDFYHPEDGSSWVPAYNRAVAYANNRVIAGTTIFFPDGQYDLSAGGLSAITAAEVSLVGASSTGACLILPSGQAAIQFGNGASGLNVGGGARSLKLKYTSAPAAGSVCFRFEYVSRLHFDDLLLENVRTLGWFGASASRFASAISWSNIRGYVFNGGSPLFDLRFGAGLFLLQNTVFVGGVLAPVHPNPMTTTLNTNVFNCVTGNWDTLMAANCLWERFDGGIVAVAGSGMVYQNLYFTNCIFDYFKSNVVYLNSTSGGVVGTVQMHGCWYVSWEGETIVVSGVGYNDNHEFTGKVVIAGKEAVLYSASGPKSNRFDLEIGAVNRVTTPSNSAMNFASGSTGFHVTNCRGNDDNTSVGFSWRAAWGILVGADCDYFTVSTNRLSGASGGYNIANNTYGSTNRRVANNVGANYAGVRQGFALPASGTPFTNTRSYAIDCFVFGGTVSGISVRGVGIPNMTNGSFRLEPGEQFVPTYSVAPAFTQISAA
jgi:hypothetical protein